MHTPFDTYMYALSCYKFASRVVEKIRYIASLWNMPHVLGIMRRRNGRLTETASTITVATGGGVRGAAAPQPCQGWVMGFVQIR